MDVVSNSFCAGGTVLGNGTWLNVGGNQPVTYGGLAQAAGQAPYENADGGKAIRLLDPNDDGTADWLDDPTLYMTSRRWYPTLETLEDGSAMIFGGCENGGYVNYVEYVQNNPTVEVSFFLSGGEIMLSGAVLPLQRCTVHPQLPSQNPTSQSIPTRLAAAFRKLVHPSQISSRNIRLQEQSRILHR